MTDERTVAFLRVLDPDDNSTGGGSASALAGAMAAALAAMVARLSMGVGGGADSLYTEIATEGGALAEELRAGGGEDASAFDGVMSAYRLPKDTEEARASRGAAIRRAMAQATRVPLRNAERCAAVQALVRRLEARSNPRALSDLQSAAYLAEAGLRGCLANVDINLPGVRDEEAASEIRERAQALRSAALAAGAAWAALAPDARTTTAASRS